MSITFNKNIKITSYLGFAMFLFATIIVMQTILFQVQMQVIVASRAYVGGEGKWAKAQKEAVRSLEHFAQSQNAGDYRAYLQFIQVPLGDSWARTELQKGSPDLSLAQAGFIIGGNHPDDIPTMINLFLRFQHTPFMSNVIEHWTKGDQLIARLDDEAKNFNTAVNEGKLDSRAVETFLAKLDVLNRDLSNEENQFSDALADVSRLISKVTAWISDAVTFLALVIGLVMSWAIIQRIKAIEDALRSSESNLRIAATAFESQESLIIADANGLIVRVNQAFTRNTGYTPEEAIGQSPRFLKSGRHSPEFYQKMWADLTANGFWQGEIWDRRKNGEIYPKWLSISAVKEDGRQITHYIGSSIDITERKASDEQIKYLAFHDQLTKLPNRRLLLDRLQMAITASARNARIGALLFIDLDNFKDLNDTLGHDMGDLLLQEVANRLSACFYEIDTVSRMGGDEFVVMVSDLGDQPIEAAMRAEIIGMKAIEALSHPFHLQQSTVGCTASIGITLFDGKEHGKDELMKQADIAMYQSKKSGRNTLRFFDKHMQETINTRAKLEGELRTALEHQEFRLFYQIQVDQAGNPIGVEALIRWQHPTRGLLAPMEFIALAEETGLIIPIGRWVLETACAQIKLWQENTATENLSLAINVSASQFYQHDFSEQVRECIIRFGIKPELLKLELTESLMLKDIDDTIDTMSTLKRLRVQLSLDDFGTGYSSLQYLKRLPLDQVKIDRSFVCDIATDRNDATIVQTIIAMAEALGLGVIAEGVETEEQRALLLGMGCSNYQGYLFGKPVPIIEFDYGGTDYVEI